MAVHHLVNGSRHCGHRRLPDRISARHAYSLLALSREAACSSWRHACGSRRRLQALVAIGQRPSYLASELGISEPRIKWLLRGETRRLPAATHESVCALYSQLWD